MTVPKDYHDVPGTSPGVCFPLPFLVYYQTSAPGFSFPRQRKHHTTDFPLNYSSLAAAAAAGLIANFLAEGYSASNARKELVGQAWVRTKGGPRVIWNNDRLKTPASVIGWRATVFLQILGAKCWVFRLHSKLGVQSSHFTSGVGITPETLDLPSSFW